MAPPSGWPPGLSFHDWAFPSPVEPIPAELLPPGTLISSEQLPPGTVISSDDLPFGTYIPLSALDPATLKFFADLPPGAKIPPSDLPWAANICSEFLAPGTMIPVENLPPGTLVPPALVPPGTPLPPWALPPPGPIPPEWQEDIPPDPFGIPPFIQPGPGSPLPYPPHPHRIGVGWFSYTGSNYWRIVYGATFYSEDCEYVSDEDESMLERADMWNQDFRPTHMRITHTADHLNYQVLDYYENVIAECDDCGSGTIRPCTFVDGFLFRIEIEYTLPCTIQKIEFYGEKVDPTYIYGVTC